MVAAKEPYAYHPGAIVRIRVHNFLTYDDAVIEPGPRLNIIVGPNGSGKSSVMCAINLGLGDDAKNLQRGDGIRAFVMRDKEKGWVEVELKGKKEGDPNIVIRRDMERGSNKSSFKVNGQKATQDNVKAMMKEMGIQLTNLCTFLPQEKVGQFTEMNPQQLLIETEKALSTGQVDLHETHVELIKEQE
jgi:chromosome segregation ATPase